MKKPLGKFLGKLTLALGVLAFGSFLVLLKNSGSVRPGARWTTMVQDGRVIGQAAQQYFLTTGKSVAQFVYDPVTGAVSGDLSPWVISIGKGYEIPDTAIEAGSKAALTLRGSLPGIDGPAVTFDSEGKTTAVFLDP